VKSSPLGRIAILVMLLCTSVGAGATSIAQADTDRKPAGRKRYVEVTPREHSFVETFSYVGSIYFLLGIGYYFTSKEKIERNASFENVTNNFGRVVIFDTDSPNANWVVHSLAGSQAYLFYRARSYSKSGAFFLTMLQSALFEFTLEIIQEPASLEDLINTPLIGSALGRGFELASIELLNSDFLLARALGHLINLPTLFGLYEGVVTYPIVGPQAVGLGLQVKF